MRWADLEERQPGLARVGRERLIAPGVVLVVTVRRDGTPRLSPVEPLLTGGGLWLSMLWGSAKAADLARDPRVLVHGIVTSRDGRDGEFKVRGTARAATDLATQRRYAAAVAAADLGWTPEPGRFHLFEVDLEHVAFLRYDEATGDQSVALWPPGREFVRRGDGATTLGEPQDVRDILLQD